MDYKKKVEIMFKKEKLFEYLDKDFGIGRNKIFYSYENEKKLIESIGFSLLVYKTFDVPEDISANQLVMLLKEWGDKFKVQKLTNIDLSDHDKIVIDWIDEIYGIKGKNVFSDYDNGNKLFQQVVEDVAINNDLTLDCGVGPLLHAITYWIQDFEEKSLLNSNKKIKLKLN